MNEQDTVDLVAKTSRLAPVTPEGGGPPGGSGFYEDPDGDFWVRSRGHWRLFAHHEKDRKGRAHLLYQERAVWSTYALVKGFGPFTEVREPVTLEHLESLRRVWKLKDYSWTDEAGKGPRKR